jgi:hypothetical protein
VGKKELETDTITILYLENSFNWLTIFKIMINEIGDPLARGYTQTN